jgi:hypothetical protein
MLVIDVALVEPKFVNSLSPTAQLCPIRSVNEKPANSEHDGRLAAEAPLVANAAIAQITRIRRHGIATLLNVLNVTVLIQE